MRPKIDGVLFTTFFQVHSTGEPWQCGKDQMQQVPSEPGVHQTADHEETASSGLLSPQGNSESVIVVSNR